MLKPTQHHFLSGDAGNACNLENGIDDWCASLRIETYFNGGIDAFGRTVTDGGVAGRTGIVMSHGNRTSFWSNSCNVCCRNSFSRSGVIPGDYHCCCSDGCGCDGTWSPNDPER